MHRRSAVTVFAIAAAFALATAPYTVDFITHHPDAHLYVESTLLMFETGNFWVPYTDEGELRLVKPILPYWFAAAGIGLFGISVFGAGSFWAAGAVAVVGLTAALARAAGLTPRASVLAAALISTNPYLLHAAVITNPDIPLTLFILISSIGLLRVLTADTPGRGAVWLFWIGAALAALSKGLLAPAFVFVGLIVTALTARDRLRMLLSPAPAITSVLLSMSWFVLIGTKHGEALYAAFVGDQLTGRLALNDLVGSNPAAAFEVFLLKALGLTASHVFYFLTAAMPWTLILIIALLARSRTPGIARIPRSALFALWGWIAALFIIFAPSDWTTSRYFLPAMPAFAIIVAQGVETRLAGRAWSKWTVLIWGFFTIALSLFLVIGAWQVADTWHAAFATVAVIAFAIALWVTRHGSWMLTLTALAPLVILVAAAPLLRNLVLPDAGAALAANLNGRQFSSNIVLFEGREFKSEFRLASQSRVPVTLVLQQDGAPPPCNADFVFSRNEDDLLPLTSCGFEISPMEYGWRNIDGAELVRAIASFRLAEKSSDSRGRGFVAAKTGER